MTTRREAHTFLASLKLGEAVLITRDGQTNQVTVQRELSPSDGGGFGSWDHSNVKVGFGPGRWNTEVTPAAIEAGHVALVRDRSIPDKCVSTVSAHHSEDLIEVFHGKSTPRILCGYHSMREGFTS